MNDDNPFRVDLNEYDFLDFGCSNGSSLAYGVKNLYGRRGIGLDNDYEKIESANENLKNVEKYHGQHKAVFFDVLETRDYPLLEKQFEFTSCIHFLEHLSSLMDVSQAIRNAVCFSRKFVYIIQPNFDQDLLLFKNGFKTYYSDWSGHTCHLTSYDFYRILNILKMENDIKDYIIFYRNSIKSSSDALIHPLKSPIDQQYYDEKLHPPKKSNVKFNGVYEEIGALLIIDSNINVEDYIDTFKEDIKVIYDSRKEE